jgi:hypothetical protein
LPVEFMSSVYWQTAVVVVVVVLAALCGRSAVHKPTSGRHEGGDVVRGRRSVMNIRNRVMREGAEYRLPRMLTIAVPTLYLVTRGTLKPKPQPKPPPEEPAPEPPEPPELQFQSPDIELMQRVLDGLRRLPEQRKGD